MASAQKWGVPALLAALALPGFGQEAPKQEAPKKIPTIPVVIRHIKDLGTRDQASRDLIDEAIERATEIWQQKDIQFGTPQHGDPKNDIDPAKVQITDDVTLADILVSAPIDNPVLGGPTGSVPTILTGPASDDGGTPVLKSDGSDSGVTLEDTLDALDKAAGAPAGNPIVVYPIPQIKPASTSGGGTIALTNTPGSSGVIGVNDSHAGETQAHEIGHRLGIVEHTDDTVMAAAVNRIGVLDLSDFVFDIPDIDNKQTSTAKGGVTRFDHPQEDRQKTRWDQLKDDVAKDPTLTQALADIQSKESQIAQKSAEIDKLTDEIDKLTEQRDAVDQGQAKGIDKQIESKQIDRNTLAADIATLSADVDNLKRTVVNPRLGDLADEREIHLR